MYVVYGLQACIYYDHSLCASTVGDFLRFGQKYMLFDSVLYSTCYITKSLILLVLLP